MAYQDGSALEHRVVAYDAGWEIPEGFQIHHKNGVRDDNRLGNLEIVELREHTIHHLRERKTITNKYGTFPILWDPAERKERERARNAASADYRREYYKQRRKNRLG
jgi:hypothetical protein